MRAALARSDWPAPRKRLITRALYELIVPACGLVVSALDSESRGSELEAHKGAPFSAVGRCAFGLKTRVRAAKNTFSLEGGHPFLLGFEPAAPRL